MKIKYNPELKKLARTLRNNNTNNRGKAVGLFKRETRAKEQRLNELGITVLRFKDEDVMNNIEGVLARIEDNIKAIGNRHTP